MDLVLDVDSAMLDEDQQHVQTLEMLLEQETAVFNCLYVNVFNTVSTDYHSAD